VGQPQQVEHLVATGHLVGAGSTAAEQILPQPPVAPSGALGDEQVLAHA
jgi:hypothetical protein